MSGPQCTSYLELRCITILLFITNCTAPSSLLHAAIMKEKKTTQNARQAGGLPSMKVRIIRHSVSFSDDTVHRYFSDINVLGEMGNMKGFMGPEKPFAIFISLFETFRHLPYLCCCPLPSNSYWRYCTWLHYRHYSHTGRPLHVCSLVIKSLTHPRKTPTSARPSTTSSRSSEPWLASNLMREPASIKRELIIQVKTKGLHFVNKRAAFCKHIL